MMGGWKVFKLIWVLVALAWRREYKSIKARRDTFGQHLL
jgi:hypothetical protein